MRQTIRTPQWDAVLDTDMCNRTTNAELTLEVRLGFRQINPAGGAAEGTHHDYGDATEPTRRIIRWTDRAWQQWTMDLVNSAQAYWHGRFWLLNNFPLYEFEAAGRRYRPNVWCRCRISGQTIDPTIYGPWDIHHMIDVVRLHRGESWFGSHATLYDSNDTRAVEKGRDSRGRPIMQRAHVHEIGHLLGLGHVDEGRPHCPIAGDTNAAACYGVADPDRRSIMGSGMALTTASAMPWRRAITRISGRGNVAVPDDWRAFRERRYPRALPIIGG